MNLLDRIKHLSAAIPILTEWLGPNGISVTQEVAQRRTDICLKCNLNQLGSTVVESVAAAIKKQKELRIGLGLRTDGIKGLKTCKACECPLPGKIWIPLDRLLVGETEESLKTYAVDCWLRNEKP